jgi:protein phosphatase
MGSALTSNNGNEVFPAENSVYADTHVGLVRDYNEDSFAYYIFPDSSNLMAAVADGIGGHESGDIASNLCLRLLLTAFREYANENMSSRQWKKFFDREIRNANQLIFSLNQKYKIQHPMGTTIVASLVLKDKIIVAHAGDSRLYRLRDAKLEKLTEDHSFVAELVRKKIISEEEALHHPFAHIISRSIGPADNMEPEINIFDHQEGDKFLLCSDGLTNHISDEEINETLSRSDTPRDAVRRLLNSSLRGGGEDNITIIGIFT